MKQWTDGCVVGDSTSKPLFDFGFTVNGFRSPIVFVYMSVSREMGKAPSDGDELNPFAVGDDAQDLQSDDEDQL